MEKKHLTCITCPIGCDMDVEVEDGKLFSAQGHICPRGEEFVLQEITRPVRLLTTTVRIRDAELSMLPVRTDKPIEKGLLFQAMEELARIEVQAPAEMYDIVIRNVAGTEANVIATRNMKRARRPTKPPTRRL